MCIRDRYYQVGGMGQFGTLMRQNIGGLLPNIIATVPLGLLLGIVINLSLIHI